MFLLDGETLTHKPLGYKPSALAIELNSSVAISGKELSLSSWCIALLYIYHFSTVVDFSSEKYSGSTGHRNYSCRVCLFLFNGAEIDMLNEQC